MFAEAIAPFSGLWVVSLLIGALLLHKVATRATASPSPPGPPPRFLVGNLYEMPTKDLHLAFWRLAEKYGPLMILTLPTSKMLVLSSAKVASDLLEKRGAIFADRPDFPMMELMGWAWDFVLEHYGDSIAHQRLNCVAVKRFAGLQTRLARVFASELLEAPSEFIGLIKRSAAASILEATYGFSISRENDPIVKVAEDALDSIRGVMIPGRFVVDSFPALRYIPTWFPGSQFKRDAAEWRVHPKRILEIPFRRAKVEKERGTAGPSVVSDALIDDTSSPQGKTAFMEAAAIMYLAGLDTTVHTITIFFLEMLRHPEVQSRAQAELSKVIGNDRLPSIEDRESLPYIEAIICELLRMYPVVPIGLPHRAMEDTWYEGIFISKGTVVYSNIWAILHDPEIYHEPHVFNPDRFMRDGKIDHTVFNPRSAVFGYGRRKCVGMHFADVHIYLSVVTTLACFNISKAVKDDVVSEPSGEFSHGILSIPVPFQCTITPREVNIKSLIDQSLEGEM